MKFYRGMIWVGAVIAVIGLIILIFQATLYVVFDIAYNFSLLDILQRFGLRDWFYSGVNGFDQSIDWALDFPLPLILIGVGGFIGLIAWKLLHDEAVWHRPP